MPKINVHSQFTLVVHGEEDKHFPVGLHDVDEKTAEHKYVQMNAEVLDMGQDAPRRGRPPKE
jgi:hypothetical protein